MNGKRIAVLRGGPSGEYEVSIKTGAGVIAALQELGYTVVDVVITKQNDWLESGFVRSPESILATLDAAFVALHGEYGEDGEIQRLLQTYQVPFTGSNALTSSIAFNKQLTKDTLQGHGIKMPRHYVLSKDDLDRLDIIVPKLNEMLGEELFIKPLAAGSSLGAQAVFTEESLKTFLEEVLQEYDSVMVEELIRGKEATVGIIDNFRDHQHYAMPVVEIDPPAEDPTYSYENKYNGLTNKICPGRFSYHEKAKLEEAARIAHQVLRCRHYSRSDFIVRNGDVYFLETNTLPGLTEESLLPKAAAAVGLSYRELVRHIIEQADI